MIDEDIKKIIFDSRIKFFGKITASISHEINNVISIINENNGLMSDLLGQCGIFKKPDTEKLRSISETIKKHLSRGEIIIKRLNKFSHSVDEEIKEFDLNDVLENIIGILRRIAYRNKIELELSLPENPVMVKNSSFEFQQIVFYCINILLKNSESHNNISISAEQNESRKNIKLKTKDQVKLEIGTEYQVILEAIKNKYNMEAKIDDKIGEIVIILNDYSNDI
jgi:C4-dicarboxylate-specific signal transduction histidine kinase